MILVGQIVLGGTFGRGMRSSTGLGIVGKAVSRANIVWMSVGEVA